MKRATPFTFERSFDVPTPGRLARAEKKAARKSAVPVPPEPVVEEGPPPPVPTFFQDDLDQAWQDGWTAGHSAISEAQEAAFAGRMAALAASTAEGIRQCLTQLVTIRTDAEGLAMHIACAAFKAVYPSLPEDFARAEVESLLEQAVQVAQVTPTVEIRAHLEDTGFVEDILTTLAAGDTVRVLTDNGQAAGDVLITWNGGGMARTQRDIMRALDRAMYAHLPPLEEDNVTDGLEEGATHDRTDG